VRHANNRYNRVLARNEKSVRYMLIGKVRWAEEKVIGEEAIIYLKQHCIHLKNLMAIGKVPR